MDFSCFILSYLSQAKSSTEVSVSVTVLCWNITLNYNKGFLSIKTELLIRKYASLFVEDYTLEDLRNR